MIVSNTTTASSTEDNMKLTTKTIRNGILFTADTVYSTVIFLKHLSDIILAFRVGKLKLGLINSYTQLRLFSETAKIKTHLIVKI